jgi:hypothetical protein
MAETEGLKITVTADTSQAMEKLRELRNEAEPLGELLEVKRDWWPYALGLSGWVAAIVIALAR